MASTSSDSYTELLVQLTKYLLGSPITPQMKTLVWKLYHYKLGRERKYLIISCCFYQEDIYVHIKIKISLGAGEIHEILGKVLSFKQLA